MFFRLSFQSGRISFHHYPTFSQKLFDDVEVQSSTRSPTQSSVQIRTLFKFSRKRAKSSSLTELLYYYYSIYWVVGLDSQCPGLPGITSRLSVSKGEDDTRLKWRDEVTMTRSGTLNESCCFKATHYTRLRDSHEHDKPHRDHEVTRWYSSRTRYAGDRDFPVGHGVLFVCTTCGLRLCVGP